MTSLKYLNFVLSFAMVCTLLAGVNVVAFAADDTETVSVSKFYNDAKKGGDGEHLFTKDADEISWLSSLKTWNNEGEAWKAPVASSTEVYRCYNPASGEHLYVDEDYADYLAATGWNKEKLAFYSDDEMGVPVYRLWNGAEGVGSHHYTTDSGEVDWLVSQGWVKEDVAFYGVADASNVVTLVDAQGLQADGSALVGDKLALVFGSTFGVPKTVAWYKDGAVVATDSTQFNQTHGSLLIETDQTGYGVGTYYAQVENTQGQVFKTNAITVTEEGVAVMSGFTVVDPYDAITEDRPMAISIDETSEIGVVTVTLNKDYDGTFYLVNSEVEEYDDITVGNSFDTETGTILINTTKEKEFTNDKFFEAVEVMENVGGGPWMFAGSSTTLSDDYAAKYTNPKTGEVTYKFLTSIEETGLGTTRGDSYYMIFDQDDDVDTDTTRDDWNTTDDFEFAYVMAPDSLAVTNIQSDTGKTGWTATLSMGSIGMDAQWITGHDQLLNNAVDIELYTNTTNSAVGGDPFVAQINATVGGVGKYATSPLTMADPSGAKAAAAQNYIYATATAPAGIFGEDELSLTSEVVTPLDEIVEGATLTYDVTKSATSMQIELTKLRGDAVAFIVDATELTDFDPTKPATYEAMTALAKGTTTATIGSFDKKDLGVTFALVIVPVDTTEYAPYGVDAQTLTVDTVDPAPVDYKLTGTTQGITAAATGSAVLVVYNQFGEKITPLDPVVAPLKLVKVSDASASSDDATFAFDATGKITLTQATTVAMKGDKWTFKFMPGKVLTFTCVETGATPKYNVTIEAQ